KPPPTAESELVKRLRRRVAHERFPIDLAWINAQRLSSALARGSAIPGKMDLVNLAEPAGTHNLVRLLELGHRPLLHADLNDAPMLILRLDHDLPFGAIVGERLLDIDILAGGAGSHGHRHMPVVGASDDDGVDVLAFEEGMEILEGDALGIGQFPSL